MRSYVIYGIRYYPAPASVGDEFNGLASWYGPDFHGKLTSNGETYNMYDMTAAHKTLPMNTIVKVTNANNGLNTVVRINDRGPFVGTRIIDLSNTAAKEIGMLNAGTAPVKVEVLGYYNNNLNDRNDVGSPVNKNRKIDVAAPTIDPRPVEKKEDLPGTSYALQIASFSKIESAIKTQEAFKNNNGYRAEIKDMENENGRIFKVWIKGFKNAQEVKEYKDLGYFKNAFIVRED
ncbi:MAG: septal ring lytic transglycosylase RlpA family protein [Sulfurimonas sp.]|nr:septal ring lytic transglycosylase RlpA family protein [Sulfurimonas sp.]